MERPTTAKPSATASKTPPTTSIFSGASVRCRDGRLNWINTMAIKVSGTLIQNT